MLFQFAPAFTFRDLFQFLKDFGFNEYILPFLLVFAIVFAVLEKTEIFGKGRGNINAVIAVSVGLLLVAQQGIVETITTFLPQVSLIIIVILMGLVVLSMLGGGAFEGLQGSFLGLAVVVAIVAVVLALSPNFGYDLSWVSPADRSVMLTIGILVGIIWLIVSLFKPKKQGEQGLVSKLFSDVEKSLRGGRSP